MSSSVSSAGKTGLGFLQPGYLKRLRVYLAEMYPIPKQLCFSALGYLGVAALTLRLNGVEMPLSPLFTLVGIWSFFAAMLIVRLMDELKDEEIDRELFPDRPLPSGRIFKADIVFTIAVVAVLYLAANLWAGPAFWAALCVLGYSFLMFRHFFFPEILRDSLLLTLATHNPLVPMVFLYGLVLASVDGGLALADLRWSAASPVVLMYWTVVFAWEIARKIRCREEENSYVTYSRIFGGPGAVLIAAAAQTAAFVIGLYFYRRFSISPVFLALWCAGYAVPLWAYARFLLNPTPATAKLGPYAEAYMAIVLVAQAAGYTLLA